MSKKGDFIPHHCVRTKKNKLQVMSNNPVDLVRFYEKPDYDLWRETILWINFIIVISDLF